MEKVSFNNDIHLFIKKYSEGSKITQKFLI